MTDQRKTASEVRAELLAACREVVTGEAGAVEQEVGPRRPDALPDRPMTSRDALTTAANELLAAHREKASAQVTVEAEQAERASAERGRSFLEGAIAKASGSLGLRQPPDPAAYYASRGLPLFAEAAREKPATATSLEELTDEQLEARRDVLSELDYDDPRVKAQLNAVFDEEARREVEATAEGEESYAESVRMGFVPPPEPTLPAWFPGGEDDQEFGEEADDNAGYSSAVTLHSAWTEDEPPAAWELEYADDYEGGEAV
jgi:hypothetical protein